MPNITKKTFVFLLGIIVPWCCCKMANAVTPMVSMGDKHGLALRSDGTVVAWGSDEYGQLGIGRAVFSAVPSTVTGLSNIRAIASGPESTYAVKNDGTVWAWGANSYGQLGDGTYSDRSYPVQVAGLAGVQMVAGGGYHSIGLKQDGTVWRWGSNWGGVINMPSQVDGLTGIVSIAAGGNGLTLALRQDGTVWSLGSNTYGQLGNGTFIQSNSPTQVVELFDIVAIAAGPFHGTALRRDGTVWEWGLGEVPGGDSFLFRTRPVQSSGVSGAVSLGTNGSSIDAVLSDGRVFRWRTGMTPALLENASNISKATEGGVHTLLLKNNQTVLGFGLNVSGQVGNGSTTFQPSPVSVTGLSGITAIAGGTYHSIALDSAGNVWTWGADTHGQLGRAVETSQPTPSPVTGITDVIYVSAGNNHSLAVKQDGTVWAWGDNQYGQLGDGTSVNRSTPVAVSEIANVRSLAAGSAHSLALKQDGTLWSWGSNWFGNLGDGTNDPRYSPGKVAGLTDIIAVAASSHSIAVRQDGTVWVWGDNQSGQLGLGSIEQQTGSIGYPQSTHTTPERVAGLSNIRTVAASPGNSYAVNASGAAWKWGKSDGVNADVVPLIIGGLSQLVTISGGDGFALAYRTDGTVWGLGNNTSGQLGTGASLLTSPTQLTSELTGITQISAGGSSSAFLRQDGTVSMMGSNNIGQLGDGTLAQRPSPVLVLNTTADGFLNLNNGGTANVSPNLQVPFFVSSTGGITNTSATVSTTTKFNPTDVGKSGAVYVTARVPSGSITTGQAAMRENKQSRISTQAASSTYMLMQLTSTGWQAVVNGQLIPYASGVLGDQLSAQSILNRTDTSKLKGAQFCLGYGTSATEMVVSGRMRAIATIPDPTATNLDTGSCVITSVTSSDCLFSWAERTYPQFFAPPGTASAAYAPYYFRHYSSTGTYLATSSSDNHVWVLGPVSGNRLLDAGSIENLLTTANCSP